MNIAVPYDSELVLALLQTTLVQAHKFTSYASIGKQYMLDLKDGLYLACEVFQFITCQFEKNMYFALRFAQLILLGMQVYNIFKLQQFRAICWKMNDNRFSYRQ